MPSSIIGAVVGGLASGVVGSLLSDDDPGGASAASAQASSASAAAANQVAAIAQDQWNYFKANFQPLETGLITEAKAAGSPAEQEEAAGGAHADVTQAFSRDRGTLNRTMATYGINPASGRFADANLKFNLGEAKADAWAQNQARKGVRDLAFSKKLDVMGLGRNIPATSSSALASASAANAGIGNQQFLRSQYMQQQARQGIAPIASAVGSGVKNWFDTGNWRTPTFNPASQGLVGDFDFDSYGFA